MLASSDPSVGPVLFHVSVATSKKGVLKQKQNAERGSVAEQKQKQKPGLGTEDCSVSVQTAIVRLMLITVDYYSNCTRAIVRLMPITPAIVRLMPIACASNRLFEAHRVRDSKCRLIYGNGCHFVPDVG